MNVQALFQRLRDWWDLADRTQKIVTVFGSLFLVALILGTAFFASRPRMEALFPGASPAEQGMVRDAVIGYGFPAEVNSRGEVMAPSDKIPEIRMRLSQDGKAPAPGGADTIASQGSPFMSPAELETQLKARKEMELAKSIMTMQGVGSAIVHINFGKDSPFGDEKVAPSAVVNLTEKPGFILGAAEAKSIARLIQNSIPGLDPAHVSVINNQGKMLWDGEEIRTGDAAATRKLEAEATEGKRREKELQKRLDAAFGPGNTLAMVTVELNMDEVELRQHRRTPSEEPIASATVKETYTGNSKDMNVGAGVGSGTDANIPGAPAAMDGQGQSSGYTSEQKQEERGFDDLTTSTKRAAGELVSMSVNVLVDAKAVTDVAAVQRFVEGALSKPGDESFTATVTPTEFNSTAVRETAKMAADAANRERMQQLIAILPVAALLIVGFFLIRAIGRQMKNPLSRTELALATGGTMSLPGHTTTTIIRERGPSNVVVRHTEHGGEQVLDLDGRSDEPQYDLSKLDDITPMSMGFDTASMSGGMRDMGLGSSQGMAELMSQMDFDEDDRPVRIGEIKEKVDVPLEQIRKLARERPETVAMLLKSWMMQDH